MVVRLLSAGLDVLVRSASAGGGGNNSVSDTAHHLAGPATSFLDRHLDGTAAPLSPAFIDAFLLAQAFFSCVHAETSLDCLSPFPVVLELPGRPWSFLSRVKCFRLSASMHDTAGAEEVIRI